MRHYSDEEIAVLRKRAHDLLAALDEVFEELARKAMALHEEMDIEDAGSVEQAPPVGHDDRRAAGGGPVDHP